MDNEKLKYTTPEVTVIELDELEIDDEEVLGVYSTDS